MHIQVFAEELSQDSWSGQLRCKCVLILSPPGRANRASSSGPVGTPLVSSGEAYVACGDAAST